MSATFPLCVPSVNRGQFRSIGALFMAPIRALKVTQRLHHKFLISALTGLGVHHASKEEDASTRVVAYDKHKGVIGPKDDWQVSR